VGQLPAMGWLKSTNTVLVEAVEKSDCITQSAEAPWMSDCTPFEFE